MVSPIVRSKRTAWRQDSVTEGTRAIPEETGIAITYNGTTYAVMMATPQDLEDFGVGFSLSERVVDTIEAIEQLEAVETELGIELRMWLKDIDAARLAERRRQHAGPTGCGLCGIESLAEAMRPPLPVSATRKFTSAVIMEAVASMAPAQVLNHETRAVHAAGYWEPGRGLVAIREDVGRHNALDKLCGALARGGGGARNGLIVLTSRISVEMVQKAASAGAPVLVAVSAPTALAVKMAELSGMTLVAIARPDGFEVFTHPARIDRERTSHVA